MAKLTWAVGYISEVAKPGGEAQAARVISAATALRAALKAGTPVPRAKREARAAGDTTAKVTAGAARSTRGERRRTPRQAMTASSAFSLTERGQLFVELWPEVIDGVEKRWQRRLGAVLTSALKASSRLAASAGVLMPQGVPSASGNRLMGDWQQCPAGKLEEPRGARVAVLLGRALLAATIAYERRSQIPLALAANTLRVIEEGGTPVSKLSTAK